MLYINTLSKNISKIKKIQEYIASNDEKKNWQIINKIL